MVFTPLKQACIKIGTHIDLLISLNMGKTMARKNKGISPSKFEWITAKRREVITQEKMG